MKAEACDKPVWATNAHAARRRTDCAGSVLDQMDAFRTSQIDQFVQISRQAHLVHDQNRLRATSDDSRGGIWSDVEGARVYLSEHRASAGTLHRIRRGDERKA